MQQLPFQYGATHVAGDYRFTNNNYLLEGLQKLQELHAPSVFIYLMPGIEGYYPPAPGSAWPSGIRSIKQLAATDVYQSAFNSTFKVFVLTTFTYSVGINIFGTSAVPDFEAKEENEMYELAKYLFNTYKRTGKIFVLKNWETDWAGIGGYDLNLDVPQDRADALIKWFNARQRGVTRARNEAGGGDNVGVFFAAEISSVRDVIERGKRRVINTVIPYTNVDMVSYSSYDSMTRDRSGTLANFSSSFAYIKSKMTDTIGLGNKRIFLAEYGTPEIEYGAGVTRIRTQATVDASTAAGIWGAFVWQLFDNECKDQAGNDLPGIAYPIGDPMRPRNNNCRGFFLIKPDGTTGAAYDILRNYWH